MNRSCRFITASLRDHCTDRSWKGWCKHVRYISDNCFMHSFRPRYLVESSPSHHFWSLVKFKEFSHTPTLPLGSRGGCVGCHAQKSYQFYLCCLLRERDWKGKRARRDIRHIYQHLTLNQQYISEEGIQKWLRVKYLTAKRDFLFLGPGSDLWKIEMKCGSYRAKNQYDYNTTPYLVGCVAWRRGFPVQSYNYDSVTATAKAVSLSCRK